MSTIKKIYEKTPSSIFIPIIFIAFIWIVHITNSTLFGYSLNYYGIHPREFSHLFGVLFAPFLHSNYSHITGNTFMLFLFSFMICCYDKRMWYKSIIYGTLIGGLITWIIGSHGIHIGASILVFSLWGTILGLAIFHKKLFFIFSSIVFFSIYGFSIFQGLIPQDNNISVAGHFGGIVAGFLSAKSYSKTSKKVNYI